MSAPLPNPHKPGVDHCENCGSTDPEDLRGGHGYTSCCNELVCSGHGFERFGTEAINKTACCWANAERIFAQCYQEIPDGSSRLARKSYRY